MISVRQTRDLPPPTFRFHLTMDTLGLGCTLPTTRADLGLSPFRNVCRKAHSKQAHCYKYISGLLTYISNCQKLFLIYIIILRFFYKKENFVIYWFYSFSEFCTIIMLKTLENTRFLTIDKYSLIYEIPFDYLNLGSSGRPCWFKSCCPYLKILSFRWGFLLCIKLLYLHTLSHFQGRKHFQSQPQRLLV